MQIVEDKGLMVVNNQVKVDAVSSKGLHCMSKVNVLWRKKAHTYKDEQKLYYAPDYIDPGHRNKVNEIYSLIVAKELLKAKD